MPLRDLSRLPDGARKQALLRAIDAARANIPLAHALRLLGLSKSRYHAWTARQKSCSLDDRPSCPRSRPGRLTFNEITAIGDMVESSDYRHMSIRALALHAQRAGRVFAHPITWGRLIRERGWRRPRLRLYPAKPKIGVKALAPHDIWHIDASVLRLIDGTRIYLHAVIDNFSPRILAWCAEERLSPMNTFNVLSRVAKGLPSERPAHVYMDSGVENLNRVVDPPFEGPDLARVLARVDVTF
jgi:putative transposase